MADEALIDGMKLDARSRMRHDPRVWYEALEGALDALLPALIEAVRAEEREKAAQIAEALAPRRGLTIAARIRAQGKEHDRG